MRLIAYELPSGCLAIRPAPRARAWIDAMRERHAYRCLPLAVANQHGWELLAACSSTCQWNGGPEPQDVRVEVTGGDLGRANLGPVGHFGAGVLTFHTGYLFRTEPGWDLLMTGPLNSPKDGIAPLTGIVEADWGPWTATVNWRFTRPGEARFEAGEPVAHIFPLPRGLIEEVDPVRLPIAEDLQLAADHARWSVSRNGFNAELKVPGSGAARDRWEGHYYRGESPGGAKCQGHRHKIRAAPFHRDGPA